MLEGAQLVLDHVKEITAKHTDVAVFLEERVDLHYWTARKDLWGTADIIIEADDELYSIDYKYGKGLFVKADDNAQLKIYALGAMAPGAEDHGGKHGFKHVTCTIIQPRNTGPNDEPIRSVGYFAKELEVWAADVLAPAAKATDSDALPVAGESQCQWCLAKPTCHAAADKVLKLCSVFEPVQKVEDLSTLANSSADSLTVEQLASIVENAPFITGWLKSVNDRVRKMLENHEAVPGLKLVRGRRMNKWNMDDAVLIAHLCKAGGKGKILQADLVESKPISAARALKLKNFNVQQKKRMQECISKSEGTLSIAPESDERPNAIAPMVFEAQHDFL